MTLWTPSNLATLPTHWWDAQDTATLTLNVNAVSAWANKGSAGGTVTQATASNQPQRSLAGFGGRQSLSFAGDQFFATIFPVGAAFRLYAVLNLSTGKLDQTILGGNSTFVPLASGPSTSGANNAEVWRINGTAFIGPRTVWRNAVSASVGTRSQIFAELVGSERIYSMRSLSAFTGYRLFEGGNAIFRPQGFIGEVLLVPEAGLTQDDEDRIVGYLAWRWGLEASLPVGHPYAGAAPTVTPSENNATATSSFSLTGSSAAELAIAAQGASGITLGGSAQGTVATAATASGSLPLTGSAVAGGSANVNASGSGSIGLTGSATAAVATAASASGSIGFTGSSAASVNITASVSGTISLTGSALAGAPTNGAIGAGTIGFSGSGAIAAPITGAGAGQLGLGGAAAVTVDIRAAGAGALPLSGAAAAAERLRVPTLIFKVAREPRLFLVGREQRLFTVAREQTIFTVTREAA